MLKYLKKEEINQSIYSWFCYHSQQIKKKKKSVEGPNLKVFEEEKMKGTKNVKKQVWTSWASFFSACYPSGLTTAL